MESKVNQVSFDGADWRYGFIHISGARYFVPAIGLSYEFREDAQVVANRYDGRVIDKEAPSE